MKRAFMAALASATVVYASAADARRGIGRNSQEISTGIGLSAALTDWTPGGFKWFNDYSQRLRGPAWLNLQLNFVFGGNGGGCYRDGDYRTHCHHYWDGYAIEFAGGVKFKWQLQRVPVQFHTKVGGAMDLLIWDRGYWRNAHRNQFVGVALGLRGGGGVRYFFLPNLGAGVELLAMLGPAFINNGPGLELYAAVDVNFGIEWLF